MSTRQILRVLAACAWMACFNTLAFAAAYKVDVDHSTFDFKVRHLLSWVRGSFRQFDGTFDYDAKDPSKWKASAVIQAGSIDTHVAPRDKHLKSKDFFDVDQFPALSFTSTSVTDVHGSKAKLHGILEIHGVKKDVVFDLDILGEATDPWGNQSASFSATTTINRKDFGLTWNQAVEAGTLLVGEEVMIELQVSGLLAPTGASSAQ